jgi:hypothetical protein
MRWFALIFFFGLLCSCTPDLNTNAYTLYRTGVNIERNEPDEAARIYIGVFDRKGASGETLKLDNDALAKYNLANCEFAAKMFNESQPHFQGSIYSAIKIKYWCEKGLFRH